MCQSCARQARQRPQAGHAVNLRSSAKRDHLLSLLQVSLTVCVCVCVCVRACVCVYVCVMFHHHHHHHTHSTLLAIPPQALRPARQVPVPPRTRGQQQCRRQGLRWTSPPQGYTKEAWRLQRLCLGKASGCHLCRGGHQAQEGILVPIHPRVPPPQCGTPQGRRR